MASLLAPPAGGFGTPRGGFEPPPATPPRVHSFAPLSTIFGATAVVCSLGSVWSTLPLAAVSLGAGILALQKTRGPTPVWAGRNWARAGVGCSVAALVLCAVGIFLPWA